MEEVSYDNIIRKYDAESDDVGAKVSPSEEMSPSEYTSSEGSEGSKKRELDLHSCTLETLDYLIKEKDSLNSSVKIVIITGKGLHSADNTPLIKNKLIGYCDANRLPYNVDLKNEGVMIIDPSFGGIQECSFVKRYNLLQKVSQGEYDLAAESKQGREELMAWGRIPRVSDQEEALIEVIKFLGKSDDVAECFKEAAKTKQGKVALNAYIKIPRAEYKGIAQAALNQGCQGRVCQPYKRVCSYERR